MGAAFDRLDPRLVRVFLIVALQHYFSTHPEYPYQKDRSKSQIFINDSYPEDSRHQNITPMIVVEGAGVRYNNDSIGNLHSMNITYPQPIPYRVHQFTATGQLAIHCLCESSIGAEMLAFEVAMFIQSMRQEIAEMLQVQHVSMPMQSSPIITAREGWPSMNDCVVSLEYTFTLRRQHTPLDKGALLKDINVIIDNNKKPGDPVDPNDPLNPWPPFDPFNPNDPNNPNGPENCDKGDGVDDGWVYIKLKLQNGKVTGAVG